MAEILPGQELRDSLPKLADDLVARISEEDPEHCDELLGAFVSQLFQSATKQSLSRERRERQAEGIAKAKARGVQFGSKRKPLPDNFDEVRRSWRNREMNLKEAARLCGMPTTTFYDAVRRAEQEEAGKQEAS